MITTTNPTPHHFFNNNRLQNLLLTSSDHDDILFSFELHLHIMCKGLLQSDNGKGVKFYTAGLTVPDLALDVWSKSINITQ